MLRVATHQSADALTFKLEGRFTGKGAEEVRALGTRCNAEMKLFIDLTEIMFIDAVGEEVLLFFKRLGARFLAETSYSQDICERLHLPLMQNDKSDACVGMFRGKNGDLPPNDSHSR